MLEKILQWDRDAFIYLNNLGIEDYDLFWSTVTNISSWIPLFVFFFVIIFLKYPKKEAIYVTLTVVALVFFITFATDVTKGYVARLRPNNNEEINTLIRILKSPTSYSFFSGHAASSFSITTLMVLFLRKRFTWSWAFYIWPLLFASSRIYVGVHYPVDILVGASVGVLSAFLFYGLYVRLIAPYLGLSHP
ncbi:phosphatase PAP2 family protein [Kriegella aquimaris]|uniref:Undecaprenyl-diphosphatase n=1 Tax=Kriegella aquimaris TaxID=192904 RepID=A0A1G9X3R1_9FLAO|nr:phosphatase PAP2 family protein [Kriegella aquimaris]SDM91322.1 undecaprenyl-diphosphatase [Kriegella aquimaris]